MNRKDVILLQSLIDYVNDVKPYHSKFREVSSEIFFSDKFNVNVKESHDVTAYFQNIWTRDDPGGHYLVSMSDGVSDSNRIFHIPATIYPRFSITRPGQLPVGDDVRGVTSTPSHQLGSDQVPVEIPVLDVMPVYLSTEETSGTVILRYKLNLKVDDGELRTYEFNTLTITINGERYFGTFTRSNGMISLDTMFTLTLPGTLDVLRLEILESINATLNVDDQTVIDFLLRYDRVQLGGEVTYVPKRPQAYVFCYDTGRYSVPYHQGSQVFVDGAQKYLGIDYTVDHTRSFIQFLPGKHPAASAKLDFNLFRSDRVFISYLAPFSYLTSGGYDVQDYDQTQSFDGDGSDYFIVTIDSTSTAGATVQFLNSNQSVKNKGMLVIDQVDSLSDGTKYVVKAIGPWTFSVQRYFPTEGPVQVAYFKTPFTDGSLSFTIDRTWSAYYITVHDDYYSYYLEQPTNSYLSFDMIGFGTPDGYDASEFFPNLGIVTQQGLVSSLTDRTTESTIQAPVKLIPFGVVKNINESYVFELDSIPERGTYVELRIEQEGQYNPWVSAKITEQLNIVEIVGEGFDLSSYEKDEYDNSSSLNSISLRSDDVTPPF